MRHLSCGALAGLLSAVAGLTGCTTLSTPVTPSSPSSPTTPVACKLDTPVAASAGYAYVCVDVTGGAPTPSYIDSYELNVNGTNAGSRAYTFPSGTCGHITGDGAGNIYQVALGTPATNITVYEFAANAGTLSPKRQFTATLSSEEVVPAADRNGNLYLQESNNSLVMFNALASGPATPAMTLTMPSAFTYMATDPSNNLYALEGSHVLEFADGFKTATPSKTMDVSSSIPSGATALALDNCGNVGISAETSGAASIYFYPPTVNGTATPTHSISSAGNFVQPTDLFIDSMGTTTVFDGNNGGAIFVDRYASDAEGAATPTFRYNEELSGQHPNRSVVY